MPAGTGNTRVVTVTGRAEEHRYRDNQMGGLEWSDYQDVSQVQYLGLGTPFGVGFDYSVGTETRTSPSLQSRWKIQPIFFLTTPYEGTLTINGTPVYSTWSAWDGNALHQGSAAALRTSDTVGAFTEDSTLTQFAGAGGFGNAYEERSGIVWSASVTATSSCAVVNSDGSTETLTINETITRTWTQPDAVDWGVGEYDWQLLWPGGSGAFTDGFTVKTVPWFALSGGGYRQPCRAACSISGTGLQYQATALTPVSCGGQQLSGTVSDATFQVTTAELWIAHNATSYFYGGFWQSVTFPEAGIHVRPDWRLAVDSFDYPYDGATAVTPTINHWDNPATGGALRGSFTSPGPYYYPASGFYRRQEAWIHPGQIVVSSARGTAGSTSDLGSVTFDNGFRKDYDEPAHLHEIDTGPPLETLTLNTFEVDEAWADAYGVLADSDNYYYNARKYPFQATAPFVSVFLDVEDNHQFQWFHDAAPWGQQVDPLFVGDNPQYHSDVSFALDGGNLKVTVPTADALLYSRFSFLARCYAYRYAKLRLKASAAGLRCRLWLDEQDPDGVAMPVYAWDFVTTGTGWEVHRFDLALPDQIIANIPGSYLVTGVPFTDVRHPVTGQVLGSGIRVWLEFRDVGDYWFDYVEGYHRPDLTITDEDTNRIPLLVNYPVEVKGSETGPFSATSPVPFGIRIMQGITNGVKSFGFIYQYPGTGPYPTIKDYWDDVKTNYADGDTGVTITPVDAPQTNSIAIVGSGDIEGGSAMGKPVTPGTGHSFQARGRQAEPFAHYGMGDLFGAYDPTVALHIDRIWDGEVAGNVHNHQQAVPGVTLNLLDDDTAAVRKTATSDADGLYRLPYRYGSLDPYSNTPRGGSLGARHPAGGSALVKALNAWWLQGENTDEDQDGSHVLTTGDHTTRRRYPILERWANWFDLIGHLPISVGGVDLVESTAGWLFRAYQDGASVYVDRSRDGGTAWDAPVLVAGDAAAGGAPALALDAWDNLYVWFQADDLTGQGYRSEDFGAAWVSYASHAALRLPRLLVGPDYQLLAYFNGGVLAVDLSQDYGVTLTTAVTFGTQPERPFVLKADRFGIPHLIYEDDSGAILHRYSEDPLRFGSWSDSAVLAAAGTLPGWGMGIHNGFVIWFEGSTPHVARLTETGAAVAAAVGPLADTLVPGGTGLLVSRNDYAFLAGRRASGLVNQYSPDEGANWTVLP